MDPVQFFKALADETRLTSLLLLQQEGELCVCELMAALQETQPKVSRHLAQLRTSGLLQGRRQGQWVFYRIHPELPAWMGAVLQETLVKNSEFLRRPLQQLRRMGERPERSDSCC